MSEPLRLTLKVAPKAAKTAVNGWMGDTLKVSVTAAPDKGKANQAVIELLAQVLGVPKSALHIVRGETSHNKTLEVTGLAAHEALRRLNK